MPVRNGARLVRPLVARLRALRPAPGWDTELIMGYNHSTDGSLAERRAAGVTVVPCRRLGPAANRNSAAREARGSLLYFLDHDAYPARPDFLERLAAAADRLGDFGALAGPILMEPRLRWNPIALADHYACWFNWPHRRPSGPTTLFNPSTSLVIPRAAFERVGGFDERIPFLHDFDIQERLKALGLPLHFCQDLPAVHIDRATLRASWGHSWAWGSPYRNEYLRRVRSERWPYLYERHELFWTNLPRLYARRLRLVTGLAWRTSPAETLYCFPFLAATVLAWAAAVCLRDQPLSEPDELEPE